jgi:hypothetical protein
MKGKQNMIEQEDAWRKRRNAALGYLAEHWGMTGLSPHTLVVLGALFSFTSGNRSFAFPSLNTLRERTGIPRSTVAKARSVLVTEGIVAKGARSPTTRKMGKSDDFYELSPMIEYVEKLRGKALAPASKSEEADAPKVVASGPAPDDFLREATRLASDSGWLERVRSRVLSGLESERLMFDRDAISRSFLTTQQIIAEHRGVLDQHRLDDPALQLSWTAYALTERCKAALNGEGRAVA